MGSGGTVNAVYTERLWRFDPSPASQFFRKIHMKQYDLIVHPNNEMVCLKCNNGWMDPEKDGNYLLTNCEKNKNGDYVMVGFQPIFIPKKYVIKIKKSKTFAI